ncbi:MFS transporter [Paenibacillus nasutitermitis]|uniref:MFS transporter n=1 Tax=Paenibacillus nasutitermitis TaxID=1652958 RepID=A0A917E3I2_9BACL|nr:MFS transporter [Paenibacillus nasutitermitis]GGD97517.1 MFS transporter [Paenibacillus nasutitermitis]
MGFRLLLLTLGGFAIGMEGFMIAGLLPALSQDLNVSISTAGQLVTVFSIVYAVGSPILTMWTGRVERKRLLAGAMLLFAAGNFLCGLANIYAVVFLGRMITAAGAGMFSPAAAGAASVLAPPDKRGRSLSMVLGGQTIALILGVPLGTWIAYTLDWRMPFWIVGVLAVLAAIFIHLFFPTIDPSETVSLKNRLSLLKRPLILSALVTSLTWGIGIFLVFTYVADIFGQFGAAGQTITILLFFVGIASFAGVSFGGYAVDRFGSTRTIVLSLFLLLGAVSTLSLLRYIHGFADPLIVGITAMALWGFSGYAFNPAQQHRLIDLSGSMSGVVLSLHNSFIYLGSALGALFGGLGLKYGSVNNLGFFSGAAVLLALIVFGISYRISKTETVINRTEGRIE